MKFRKFLNESEYNDKGKFIQKICNHISISLDLKKRIHVFTTLKGNQYYKDILEEFDEKKQDITTEDVLKRVSDDLNKSEQIGWFFRYINEALLWGDDLNIWWVDNNDYYKPRRSFWKMYGEVKALDFVNDYIDTDKLYKKLDKLVDDLIDDKTDLFSLDAFPHVVSLVLNNFDCTLCNKIFGEKNVQNILDKIETSNNEELKDKIKEIGDLGGRKVW